MMTSAVLSKIEENQSFAATENSSFTNEILNGGVEIIAQIFDEWSELCEKGGCNEASLRPEWFLAFVKSFKLKASIIVVRRGEKLKAVLPLVLKRESFFGLPVLKLAAIANNHTLHFDLIHDGDESEKAEIIAQIWQAIKTVKGFDLLEIRLAYKNGWLNDLLEIAKSERYLIQKLDASNSPFVTLPQSIDKEQLIESYFKGLTQNRRKLLNRNLRNLNNAGNVEFTLTRGYSEELMANYFALEESGWKGREKSFVGSEQHEVEFYQEFARLTAKNNALFIHELKCDGELVAMYLSIQYGKRTIGWKMSYNEKYNNFSPGNLIFKEVLSRCMRDGSTELDMTPPPTYFKSLWASGEHESADFYIFNKSLRGKFLKLWLVELVGRIRELENVSPDEKNKIKLVAAKIIKRIKKR
ncbi:MAG: GNAT family N-acetyltransferase [Pyrinomonadaceae bacterium]|nr:GNAT family N-acetyltransferase [Pyrinomonadaceae bacterium]